jgi:hypothetical protein
MAIYSLRLAPIGKTTQKRPFTAAAHIRYITRKEAVSHVMAERMPERQVAAMRWLRAEEKADRVNARVADKLVIALPRELSRQQHVELLWGFAEELSQGRVSWFAAIHAKGKDRFNPHCHLLVRDRDVRDGKRVVMFSAGQKEAAQCAAKGQPGPTTLRKIREMWGRHTPTAPWSGQGAQSASIIDGWWIRMCSGGRRCTRGPMYAPCMSAGCGRSHKTGCSAILPIARRARQRRAPSALAKSIAAVPVLNTISRSRMPQS